MANNYKVPAPSESVEQICLFRWAEFQRGLYPELRLMFHIPNEGKRSKTTGARMKKEGLKAGVPDIFLPVAKGHYHGLFIEMKAGNNKTTENQEKWLEELSNQGYATAVCYGWEAASEVLMKYLDLKGEQIC